MRLAIARACAVLLVLTVTLPWIALPGARAGDDETPAQDAPKKDAPKRDAPKAEAPKKDAPPPGGMTRKDIEELVRRGGRLPEGFIPHGMRPGGAGPGAMGPGGPGGMPPGLAFGPAGGDAMQAAFAKATGTLILRYLAEKDDPVRAAVYEELLKEVGTMLAEGEAATIATYAPRIMARLVAGLQDPTKAPVYRDIMRTFGAALTGAGPRPPRAVPAPAVPSTPPTTHAVPAERAHPDWPRTFAGAPLAYRMLPHVSEPLGVTLERVPEDSLAHQIGLRAGDTLLAVDGASASPAALKAADKAFVPGGQLKLRVRRKEGTVEVLDLAFEADDDAADPKK